MNPNLDKLAESIAQASKLSSAQLIDLKMELLSDFAERERDLLLAGVSLDNVYLAISSEFNDSKRLGKEFFYAHQPLARIPFVGELFYYKPLWYAIMVLVSEVVVYILTFFVLTFFIQNLLGGLMGGESLDTIYLLIEIGLFILFIMLRGWWLYQRMGGISGIVEAYSVLYVPLLVLAVIVFVRFNLDFSQPQPVPYLFAIAYVTLSLGISLIGPMVDVLFSKFARRVK